MVMADRRNKHRRVYENDLQDSELDDCREHRSTQYQEMLFDNFTGAVVFQARQCVEYRIVLFWKSNFVLKLANRIIIGQV